MTQPMMGDETYVEVDGAELCVQTAGDPGDPAVLLIGNSMLSWPDGVCERLAAAGRFAVRYDLRDTGRSTTRNPDAPAHTLRDLVADAAALIGTLGLDRAHVAGLGPGGWIAQLLALDHPERVASLTLVGTRPVAPGPTDADLPDHAPEVMQMFGSLKTDWTDRDSVVDTAVAKERLFAGPAFDEDEARATAGRIFDRTAETAREQGAAAADAGARHRSDQLAITFAGMDSGERWRERLGGITSPVLVVHGAADPFFPPGNGEALAAAIPGAELLILDGAGAGLPRATWDRFVPALAAHTTSR